MRSHIFPDRRERGCEATPTASAESSHPAEPIPILHSSFIQPHITRSIFPRPLSPVPGTESGVRMEVGPVRDADVQQRPLHTRCPFQCIYLPLLPPLVTLFPFVAALLTHVSCSSKEAWKSHKVLLETRIRRPLSFPLPLRSEEGVLETHA